MALRGKVDTLCRLTPRATPPADPHIPPSAPATTRNRTSVEPYVRVVLRDAEIALPSLPLPPTAPRRRLKRREAPPTEEDAPYVDPCADPWQVLRVTYVRSGNGAYQRTFVSLQDVQRACGFNEGSAQIRAGAPLLELSDIAFAYARRKALQDVALHTHCSDMPSTACGVFVSAEWALDRMAEARRGRPDAWNEACELVAAEIRAKNDAWLAMRGEEERPPGLLREPFSRYRPPVVTVDRLQA